MQPYEAARSPPCDTPQDHPDRPGHALSRDRACRADDAGLHRERRGFLLIRMQGRLRQLLQEEPGPVEVPGPVAALPRELHQEQALV